MSEEIGETLNFADVDFCNPNVMCQQPHLIRRCPVVVTLSNNDATAVDVQQFLEAGMNIAKIKMSTTTEEDRIAMLDKIETAAAKCCDKFGVKSWPIATCIQLKTHIVTTGILHNDLEYVMIETGSNVKITNDKNEYNKCNKDKIFVDNPYLAIDLKVGTEISIISGEITMVCTEIVDQNTITCTVIKGGKLNNMSVFCARNIKHSRPFITKKDFEIMEFGLKYQIDIICINYVRETKSIQEVKEYFKGHNTKTPIILCGITDMEGLKNIDEILKVADGIILSRDFLPYELAPAHRYKLPSIQKWASAKCHQAGKPFFIRGGVFEEAFINGQIEDRDVTDVANALLDGVSGFIFKDCYNTNIGVRALKTFNELCNTIDPLTTRKSEFYRLIDEMKVPVNAAEAAIMSCAMAANQTNSKIVVIPTVSGRTVRALHRMRLSCLIITVSTDIRVTRLLYMYRGVVPLLYSGPRHSNWDDSISGQVTFAVEHAVQRNLVGYGDIYVTLERHSHYSTFCDKVIIRRITFEKEKILSCHNRNDEVCIKLNRIAKQSY